MKRITVVMVMSLAMVVIMAFTCYAQTVTYKGCYNKENGELRILTDKKDSDKKDCDKKDPDKNDSCKRNEISITLLGGSIPSTPNISNVPAICAGYVDCANASTCVFSSSCISSVVYGEVHDKDGYIIGNFQISFKKDLQSPICVFNGSPDVPGGVAFGYSYSASPPSMLVLSEGITLGPLNAPFSFICTEP